MAKKKKFTKGKESVSTLLWGERTKTKNKPAFLLCEMMTILYTSHQFI